MSVRSTPLRVMAGLLLALPFAWPAAANSPGESSTPGAFVAACGGIGTGGFVQGGESMYRDPPNYGNYGMFSSTAASCNSNTSGSAFATLSTSLSQPNGSSNGYSFSDSAQAAISLKQIHVDATMTGPASAQFPTGAAQAGWTDTLNFGNQPAGTPGLTQFQVLVHGTLQTLGDSARPGFWVTPYINGSYYSPDSAGVFTADNPHPVIGSLESVGYETRIWWNPADSPGPTPDLAVNELVTFTIPFTFGQQFSFGLYAVALAGNGSYGPDTNASTAISDFAATITWEGISEVDVGGSPVSYSLTSGSGIDWTTGLTAAPEPGTLAVLGVGVGGLSMVRRGTSRGRQAS